MNDRFFEMWRETAAGIGRLVAGAQAEILSPCGLGARHAHYLIFLGRAGEGATLAECSRALRMDRANSTRVVRDLIEKGCAERENGLAKGSRVRLTEQGKTLAEALCCRAEELRGRLMAELTEEESETLFRIMNKFEKCV